MKTALFSLIFFIGIFSTKAYSQRHEAGFRISIPDASNRSIFERNSDLYRIEINYRNDEAAFISIYNQDGKGGKWIETLYTYFKGDCYILSKKYPGLKLPQAPKLDVWHFNNVENLRDSSTTFKITTTLKRDSLIHNFDYFITQKGTYEFLRPEWNAPQSRIYKLKDSSTRTDTVYYLHPALKGNPLHYEKKLTHSYKQWKPIAVADSALMITGIVERNGSLSDIQLQMGRRSAFSDRVLEFIAHEANQWWPMRSDFSSIVRARTKIFVRLNPDDSVTFSTL